MAARRSKGSGSVREVSPGVWRVRVYVGRDPVTHTPRQVERTIHGGKAAAERARRTLEAEVAEGRHRSTRGTVGHLLEAWLAHLETVGREPTTIASYRTNVTNHLVPGLGKIELAKLTAFDLDEFYRDRKAAGLAPRTIRTLHATLSSALSQAVRWGWITVNPIRGATPPAKPKSRKRVPAPEQVRLMIEQAADEPDMATAIVLLALLGGRRGELCGLQWPDVDWATGTIWIRRQRVLVSGRGVITKAVKYDDEHGRLVALGPLGVEVLRRYQAALAARAVQLGVEPVWDGWLLSYDCGRSPLTPQGLNRAIVRLAAKAGVGKVTPHAFRRFAATHMLGAGVDVRTAAGRLGHTPEVLLREYAAFLPSRDVDAARGLEGLVLGPTESEET